MKFKVGDEVMVVDYSVPAHKPKVIGFIGIVEDLGEDDKNLLYRIKVRLPQNPRYKYFSEKQLRLTDKTIKILFGRGTT